jgi:hypothetical protein
LKRIDYFCHPGNYHHNADHENAHGRYGCHAAERDQPREKINGAKRDDPTPFCA